MTSVRRRRGSAAAAVRRAAARLEDWFARAAGADGSLAADPRSSGWRSWPICGDGARAASIEGLMLKRGDSALSAPGGRRDVVEVEARTAHHRCGADVCAARAWQAAASTRTTRSACGARRGTGAGRQGVFGFTDEELAFLDRWIRNHTTARFGPVREVEKALVLEVAFDAAQISNRHKSGVALRFPRIVRIRTRQAGGGGGPAGDADGAGGGSGGGGVTKA